MELFVLKLYLFRELRTRGVRRKWSSLYENNILFFRGAPEEWGENGTLCCFKTFKTKTGKI